MYTIRFKLKFGELQSKLKENSELYNILSNSCGYHKNEKEKREIRIFAPFRPVIRREEAEMRAHEKALEEERVKVLTFSRKIRSRFYALPMIIGAFLLGFSAYIIVTNAVLVAGSPEATMLFIVAFIFMGVVEVIGGLLLMGG